jgi:S1-C subfamily serine protease
MVSVVTLPKGITIKFVAIIVLCWSFGTSLSALSTDATVVVMSFDHRDVGTYGTGYVSTADGEVITCYHVVSGAHRITVSFKDGWYAADVVAISPDRDIAVLRMNKVPRPTVFYPALIKIPSDFRNLPLTAQGFNLGIIQTFKVSATFGTFVPSEKLDADQLKP